MVRGETIPFCPKCGTEVNESDNFCLNCGNNLGEINTKGKSKGAEESSRSDAGSTKGSDFKSADLDEKGEETAKELRDKGIIGTDERVLVYSRQPRYKSRIKPASMIVTDRQVVYYNPNIIGSDIETRTIDEITDIAIDSGFKNATITIRSMAMDNLIFENFPKEDCQKIRNAIRRLANQTN